ncbi:MAG: penicillin-binding protein activator [Arenicellales bacterium]|nr:penicillin-binding protein activator [Arenicellales bacterium]
MFECWKPYLRLLGSAATVTALWSCASAPTTQDEPSPEITAPTVKVTPFDEVEAPEVVQPEPTYATSDLVNAAHLWLDQARFAPAPEQQDLLLRSAAALLKAKQLSEARQILNGIDVSGLPVEIAQRRRLLRAELALAEDRAELALRYLAPYKRMQDPQLRAQALSLRAQAHLASNDRAKAIRALIEREAFLDNLPDIEENRQRIWALLGSLTDIELQIERQSTDDGSPVADWLDLALLYVDFGVDPHRLQQTITDWAEINPLGSAQTFAVEMLRLSSPVTNEQVAPIQNIALLLPLASKFGRAAQSVHDGFMAMHTLDGNPYRPNITVYDVGEIPELAGSYYRLAVEEGADLIVGPLGKQAANAIIDNQLVQVPTLLLGGIQQGRTLPPNTYQIDLAPEQEATQVATRAYLDGHRVAGVLWPNTDWGQRIAQAFVERWESLGGIVVGTQAYEENSNDHSFAVQEILNINNSNGRKSALSALLGTKLEFQPRRRQDLDMLFLAARPVTGRLIKPQINFFHAHDIPVYSTSHIYTGTPDPVNDTDLNQITFGDMPWLLRNDNRAKLLHASVEGTKQSEGNLKRLFALGMDAYLLSRVLPYLEADTAVTLKGVTADRLSVNKDRHIERQLTWARFEKGEPSILDTLEGPKGYENIEPDQMEQIYSPLGTRSTSGATGLSISN